MSDSDVNCKSGFRIGLPHARSQSRLALLTAGAWVQGLSGSRGAEFKFDMQVLIEIDLCAGAGNDNFLFDVTYSNISIWMINYLTRIKIDDNPGLA